jgi:hypothetical protein
LFVILREAEDLLRGSGHSLLDIFAFEIGRLEHQPLDGFAGGDFADDHRNRDPYPAGVFPNENATERPLRESHR